MLNNASSSSLITASASPSGLPQLPLISPTLLRHLRFFHHVLADMPRAPGTSCASDRLIK
jgi:hypothetical protein